MIQRLSVILKGHLMQCFDSSQSSEMISRLRRKSSRNILTRWMRRIRQMSDWVSKQETLCLHAFLRKIRVWNILLYNRLLLCFSVITVATLQNQLRNLERNQRDDKALSLTVTRKCLSVFCDRWIHIIKYVLAVVTRSKLDFSRADGTTEGKKWGALSRSSPDQK